MIYEQENRVLTNNSNANNNATSGNNNRTATQVLPQPTSNLGGQHYRQQQSSTIRPLIGHSSNSDDSSAQTISSLKDTLISLEYRIKMLQSQVQLKMQRQECFTLLDRKANMGYVKKTVEEIYAKMEVEREWEEKRVRRVEEEQGKRVEELRKKLKQTNTMMVNPKHQPDNNPTTKPPFTPTSPNPKHMLIRPQQLFLQSNQTMFSMLVDQINSIKHNQQLIQRLIQSKHKKTVGLNNEVCRKLQTLQRQMEEMVKYVDWMGSDVASVVARVGGSEGKVMRQKDNTKKQLFSSSNNNKKNQQIQNNLITYHSNSNNFYGSRKPTQNKKLVSRSQSQQHLQQPNNTSTSALLAPVYQPPTTTQLQSFQSIRLQLFSKSLQSIQKQLSLKLNIKDLLPFIKQNVPNLGEPIEQIKQYIEQNLQSMRKILESQAQINQELTKASRVAWFHCYEKFTAAGDSSGRGQSEENQLQAEYSLGYILFGQQLVNVMPECISISTSSQYTLTITSKGWYMIRVFIKQPKQHDSQQILSQQQSHNDIQLTHSLWVEVNGVAKYPLMMGNYRLLNLAVDNFIRVITHEEDVFVEVRRL